METGVQIENMAQNNQANNNVGEQNNDIPNVLKPGWTCKRCDYTNKPSGKFCGICGDKKPVVVQGWTCTFCKSVNKPLIPSCCACDSRRPDDYVIPKDYITVDPQEIKILEAEKEAEASFKTFLVIILFHNLNLELRF